MKKGGFVYILASKRNGTLYIGVTSNLVHRLDQHQIYTSNSFTSRYHIHSLVWYEQHDTIDAAITREKQLKKWNRAWKIKLIESVNPNWMNYSQKLSDWIPACAGMTY